MGNFKNNQQFTSPGKLAVENLMKFYDIELDMMANELIDSLTPAVKSMQAVQIVLQMQIELADHIKSKGNSDKALKSAKRLKELYLCVMSLNTLTGDINTLQLANRELNASMKLLKIENEELKSQIENVIKAETF